MRGTLENLRSTESEQETRVALLTGATSGIGFRTAVELAHRQVRVLLHGRSVTSAEEAVARLRAEVPLARVHAVWADLGVMSEVRALAVRVLEEPRLDVLVHNAGLERWQRSTAPDGFEVTFAVNYLAPFLLTRLLTPLLERSKPSRIVFISSVVHGWGVMHWDDLQARGWWCSTLPGRSPRASPD
jgi:NAD(P)-dependent dehydrogenase (short-subunit alcohol dehydrogenase family)